MPANLQVNYAAAHNRVMQRLAQIQEATQDMPSPDCDKLQWSNYGELRRLERDLEDILEYLSPD